MKVAGWAFFRLRDGASGGLCAARKEAPTPNPLAGSRGGAGKQFQASEEFQGGDRRGTGKARRGGRRRKPPALAGLRRRSRASLAKPVHKIVVQRRRRQPPDDGSAPAAPPPPPFYRSVEAHRRGVTQRPSSAHPQVHVQVTVPEACAAHKSVGCARQLRGRASGAERKGVFTRELPGAAGGVQADLVFLSSAGSARATVASWTPA